MAIKTKVVTQNGLDYTVTYDTRKPKIWISSVYEMVGGGQVVTQYDGAGNPALETTTYPGGKVVEDAFSGGKRLRHKVTNKDGSWYEDVYGKKSRTRTISANGKEVVERYGVFKSGEVLKRRETTMTSGKEVTETFNRLGKVIKKNTHDEDGNLLSSEERDGTAKNRVTKRVTINKAGQQKTEEFFYTGLTNGVKQSIIKDYDGHQIITTYGTKNKKLSQRTELPGVGWQEDTFGPDGKTIMRQEKTYADGSKWIRMQFPAGNYIIQTHTANGLSTQCYNKKGYLTSNEERDSKGNSVITCYKNKKMNLVCTMVYNEEKGTTATYDQQGRLESIIVRQRDGSVKTRTGIRARLSALMTGNSWRYKNNQRS